MSLESILKSIFGSKADRDRKKYLDYVAKNITPLREEMAALSNDELRQRVADVRADIHAAIKADEDRIAELKAEIETLPLDKRQPLWTEIDHLEKNIKDTLEVKLDEHLPVVFSAMRDAARRFAKNETIEVTATDLDRDLAGRGCDFLTIDGDKAIYKNRWIAGGNEIVWDMEHYDVQMVGGKVLNEGKIAEMATGEGKTLVATLPVFLRSLTGRGVHVVTVNDYLAKRDSEWMGPLYQFLGSTVDCIDKHDPNTAARRAAYHCDITYGTNNESVSTTCATIWPWHPRIWCSAPTITPLSTRLTRCLSTMPVRRSSSQAPCPRARSSTSTSTSTMSRRLSRHSAVWSTRFLPRPRRRLRLTTRT